MTLCSNCVLGVDTNKTTGPGLQIHETPTLSPQQLLSLTQAFVLFIRLISVTVGEMSSLNLSLLRCADILVQ